MSDWQEVTLGEICNIEIGGTPSRSDERYWWKSDDDGIRLPWVSISDMKGKVVTETKESITEIGALQSNCKHVPQGTLLMSFKLTIGRLAFAGRDLYTNEAISAIRPTKDICPEFLYHGLHHWNLTGDSDQAVKGVTLNKQKLQEIPCLLPPLPEQKKIAEILSGIDKAITSIKTESAKLVLLKKSLSLKLLATKSDQGRQATFGEVCIRIQDGTHFSPQSKDGDSLYITSKNIRPGRLDLSATARISTEEHNEIYKRCPVKKGDILLTKDGANTGNACLNTLECEFSLLSSVAFIRPETNQCDPNYMLQWILSDMFQGEIQQGMSGNAISRLTLSKINNLPIHLPPLEKQKEIAGILLSIDNQCGACNSKAESLHRLKSAISSDLLSGRKRVSV